MLCQRAFALLEGANGEGRLLKTKTINAEQADGSLMARAVFCLEIDIAALEETVKKLRLQIDALTARHGV